MVNFKISSKKETIDIVADGSKVWFVQASKIQRFFVRIFPMISTPVFFLLTGFTIQNNTGLLVESLSALGLFFSMLFLITISVMPSGIDGPYKSCNKNYNNFDEKMIKKLFALDTKIKKKALKNMPDDMKQEFVTNVKSMDATIRDRIKLQKEMNNLSENDWVYQELKKKLDSIDTSSEVAMLNKHFEYLLNECNKTASDSAIKLLASMTDVEDLSASVYEQLKQKETVNNY